MNTTLKILSSISLLAAASSAYAHGGHVHESAGHSHYLALGAAALAGGIVVYLAVKAMKKRAVLKAKRAA